MTKTGQDEKLAAQFDYWRDKFNRIARELREAQEKQRDEKDE